MKDEILEVPEELKEIMADYQSALGCRDECVRSVFRAKRAIYYGRIAEKSRMKFWREAERLYPQLSGNHDWKYVWREQRLELKKDDAKA